jgi:uncharacterized membrane protein
VAVVLMMVVHARRLQPPRLDHDPGAAEALLRLLMWAEPLIAAYFLFIVGFSLVLSQARHAAASDRWLRRAVRRALRLYLLSVLLFVPQFGVQLPHLLTSSGILSAIAVAILLVALCLAGGSPRLNLGLLVTAILTTTALLDTQGIWISGINAGPGGAFPIVAFSAAGAGAALLHQRAGLRGLLVATLLSAVPTAAALLSGQPWVCEHGSVYTGTAAPGAAQAMGALLGAAPTATAQVRFWNHSAIGALGLLLPLAASLLLFLCLQQFTRPGRLLRPLGLLGRHALAVYVGHLALLGLMDLLGLRPANALWTWMLVAALTAVAILATAAREALGIWLAVRTAGSPPRSKASFCGSGYFRCPRTTDHSQLSKAPGWLRPRSAKTRDATL